MGSVKYASVHLTLSKNASKSFLAALDEAQVSHSPIHKFSESSQTKIITEAITAISEAMPWNTIARVFIAWLETRKSREIIIHTEAGETIYAKGYSAPEIQKILQKSINVTVIDTEHIE